MAQKVTKSVKFNAVMNTLLTASNTLVGLITLPYVTRVLSVEGYGNVTFAQSLSTWLSALCTVGITAYGVRECARVRNDKNALAKLVCELLLIITIFTIIVMSIFAICIILIPRFVSIASLLWMFLISTILTSYGVEWYFQAIEEYEYITIRSVTFKAISLISILLFIHHTDDWLLYGAITAIVPSCNNIFNILRLHKDLSINNLPKINILKHFKPLISYFITAISSACYTTFDSVLLGLLNADNVQVAFYQIAVKIRGICFQIINSIIGALIPRLAYYAKNTTKRYYELLQRGNGFLVNLCLGIMLYLIVYAYPLVTLISSAKYSNAAIPIQIIGVANFFACLNYYYELCVLSPLDRERYLAIANSAGLLSSLLLNASLDHYFGAAGASIASAISEFIVFSIVAVNSRDILCKIMTIYGLFRTIIPHLAAFGVSMIQAHILSAVAIEANNAAGAAIKVLLGFITYSIIWLALAYSLKEETCLWLLNLIKRQTHKIVHHIK